MTGTIGKYYRQHSSTANNTATEKNYRPKLRRCSSADDHISMESLVDDDKHNDLFVFKREHTTSDIDSGTEEIEQQLEQICLFEETQDNENDDEIDDETPAKLSGANQDEGFSEFEAEERSKLARIKADLLLAKEVLDDEKKDFCADTSTAFHGEYARLISVPLSLCHNVRYYLFAEEELQYTPFSNMQYAHLKLDNAKAQFKCPNVLCQHAWTSMRARISFKVSTPDTGFVVLKIFSQCCQRCGTSADALWYIDEVCRVMKNLTKFIFEQYFPDMINNVDLSTKVVSQESVCQPRRSRHDPTQRKGKMLAPHAKEYCEACRYGLCFY